MATKQRQPHDFLPAFFGRTPAFFLRRSAFLFFLSQIPKNTSPVSLWPALSGAWLFS